MNRPAHTRPTSIMAEVARIRHERASLPLRQRQAELARALDHLDALGALEEVKPLAPCLLCWGAQTFAGITPSPWVGAALWRRAAGYYGYKTLRVIGIWALDQAGETVICVGAKALTYAADFYEAEAYHKLIARGFALYYRDDGSPPPVGACALIAPYAAENRLELRTAVMAALRELMR